MKMNYAQFNFSIVVIVLNLIFIPQTSHAMTTINNTILVETNTGGNSASGEDGTPGKTGMKETNGVDGTDGKNGRTITTGDETTIVDILNTTGSLPTPEVSVHIENTGEGSTVYQESIVLEEDDEIVVRHDVNNTVTSSSEEIQKTTQVNEAYVGNKESEEQNYKKNRESIMTIIIQWFKRLFTFSF